MNKFPVLLISLVTIMKSFQLIRLVVILLLTVFIHFNSNGQVFSIESVKSEYNLDPAITIFEDQGHSIEKINQLLKSDDRISFVPLSKVKSINPDYAYWAKVKINNQLIDSSLFKNWKLFTDEADYINVYLVDSNQVIQQSKITGLYVPNNNKELKLGNKVQRVNLSLLPGQIQYLYVNYKRINNQPINIHLSLKRDDFFSSWKFITHSRRSWLFIGFMLTMLIINLAFFVNTNDKAYLFHAVFIFASLLFLSDYYGILADLIFIKDHPFLIGHIDYIAISLLSISYISFTRYYLEVDRLLVNGRKIFNYLIIFQLVSFLIVEAIYSLSLNEPVTDKLLASSILIVFFLVHTFFISNYKLKSTRAYFLIAGSLLIFIALGINSISIFLGHGVLNETTEILFSGEILIFSLGLGYRIKELYKEEKEVGRLLILDNFKNKFYSNISHEFRTPLTVISGTAETLKEKADQGKFQNGLETIIRNSAGLLKLVNQMLDISKIESNSMMLIYRQQDLVTLIKRQLDSMQYFAARKNINIQFLNSPVSLIMDLDEEKLNSILSNLLSNAIKFTPENGIVEIEVIDNSQKNNSIEILIKDTGYGMDQNQLIHIFDRFYSGEPKSMLQLPGTGIGLSLTKELVQLMKGSITVNSEIGVGSTFKIILPFSKVSVIQVLTLPVYNAPGNNNEPKQPQLEKEYQDDLPVLLIIEDNDDILNFLISILENDYNIQWAKDGNEGKLKAEKIIPDLIISDIMMPGKDGITLSYELKENELTNHIPIILLTAKAEIEDKMEGLKAGADAYLVKPFRKEELMIRLEKLNQLRKDLRNKYSQIELLAEPKLEPVEYSFLNRINDVIDQNIDNEQFSVEELADQLFISRMQLHRKLKAITDKSASHYIRAFRLIKAKPLLHDLSRSISEIAFEVGFSDPNYFSKSFLKEFGINPSDYRVKLVGK